MTVHSSEQMFILIISKQASVENTPINHNDPHKSFTVNYTRCNNMMSLFKAVTLFLTHLHGHKRDNVRQKDLVPAGDTRCAVVGIYKQGTCSVGTCSA